MILEWQNSAATAGWMSPERAKKLTEETVHLARLSLAWSCLARAIVRQRDATNEHARSAAAVDIAHAEAELRAMGVKL